MVEWKKIWEVTTWDKRFSGIDKNMQPQTIKYHYYLANELTELERQDGDIRILYTTERIAFADSTEVEANISEGEVVTIPWGGNVSIKYFKGKFITADNRIATSNNTDFLSNKYLYYWMLSQKDEIGKFYRGAGIQHPSMYKVLTFPIPIPSLSEQKRIVGILDTFTDSIENLKQQIAQRRKQYEHYRDQLLDLEGKEGVEMKTLGDVCIIKNGYTPSTKNIDFWENGTIPWFTLEDIRKNGRILADAIKHITPLGVKKGGLFSKNSIIISTTATIGEYALIQEDFLCNQQITCLSLKNSNIITSKYLYYLADIIGRWCKKNVNGGGSLLIVSSSKLNYLSIPVPPLAEQQRIVSILDTFEASISNLEAQLEQRQKQYEYYRNKLLTFEKEEQ